MNQFTRGKTTLAPNAEALRQNRTLDYQEVYLCPACRHGQIEALILMDAFACNFCHHIFVANLPAQSIHVADNPQPMGWRWNGKGWQSLNQGNTNLTGLVWLMAIIIVLLPPALIALAAYMFPPLEGSNWQFPLLWTGLTFSLHFALVAWLMVEHYQFPLYVTLKVKLRELFRQR
jgi:hypothetical protein